MFGIGKYKEYIDELTAILDASSEIIFLCNNFDITRIQDLFINIIENYNYYEKGKNETSQTERLGDEISGSAEYIKMKEYIDKNFENIKDKCECFTTKLDGFRRQYLPDIDDTQDSDDALIRDNFKSQYKTIRINLEDIERELSKIKKITEPEITAIKDDDIQFNIFPITKSNMMYSSTLYSSFKMIFKNLQIIDSNENEITEQELDEINKDLKKLYINLIENFNNDTINAQESVLKNIIADLTKEGTSLKDKYDSYIKKGGDVKGEEGEGDGEDKVEGKEGKGNVEGKDKDDEEGKGENVKKLEEKAERLTKEADEAKLKADELKKKAEAANSKKSTDVEEQLKNTEDALVAATAARDAAKVASDAKNAADKANLAAAAAAEAAKKEAERKAEEAKKNAEEDAKKKAEEAAAAKKKADEDAKKKDKEAEEAKKKAEEAEEAKKKADEEAEEAKKKADEEAEEAKKKADDAKKKNEEDPSVFNFEYNHSSCYVNSALQMLIDNEELCDKIINAANTQTFGDTFNGDKTSDSYLLYLLNKIIVYYRENKDSIGKPKKPSYNEYILPLREYLDVVNQAQFKILNDADPSDLFEFILNKLENLKINKEYYETKLLILNGDEEESFDKIIKYQKPHITSNKENLIFKIGRSRSKRIPNTDTYLRDENNNTITEEVTKSITLSPKLILGEDNKNSTYILKGFIHFVPPGHYIYYKSLNNSKNEWVILDDLDANRFPDNDTEQKVDGHPLGKNGNKILQKDVKTTGSTLFYYKKEKDDTALNASPIGVEKRANAEEDDSDLQAALAASLADQKPVANATEPPFKYSFDIGQGFTPVYNKINKPYYLDKEGKKQATFMASLNAGHQNLRVEGGPTINGAFNRAITKKENIRNSTDKDDDVLGNKFIEMHISCYMNYYEIKNSSNTFECPAIVSNDEQSVKAVIAPILQAMNNKYNATDNAGKFYKFIKLNENDYISAMYLYISEKRLDNFHFKGEGTFLYPGDVFIDILKYPPHDYSVNKAMIYCTGPAAYTNDGDMTFFDAVKIVGMNIANAITEYNKIIDIEKIDYARICLISGGQFAGNNDRVKIAEALINGIHSVNIDIKKSVNYDIVYNFTDNNLKTAFDNLKANDPLLASAELIIPKT